MNSSARAIHLDLDGAWPANVLPISTVDSRAWGPQLRFSAPPRLIETFAAEIAAHLPPFVLYGSGDFHHLSGIWVRRLQKPAVFISFDNHPDWDVRPPKWCCGSWVNRALELPQVAKVAVWGCGNFECWWPGQFFGNRRAERAGTLEVHPFADGQSPKRQARRGAILQENWREKFEQFVDQLGGLDVYVTIDIDCLREGEAVTNWENGKLSTDDVAWALQRIRKRSRIVAGDLCGAFSVPHYARRKQRFASEMDHPKTPPPHLAEAQRINLAAFEKLWPALTEGDEDDAGGDQERAGCELER